MITICKALISDVDELAVLLDEYRQFYQQKSDVGAAKAFLTERLQLEESVLFFAKNEHEMVGFTQLYPTFTSVGLGRTWLLNDLYVRSDYRNLGVATLLIKKVIEFSKVTNRKKIFLSTATDNLVAQKLYEKIGFSRDDFYNYEYMVQ